MDDYLNNDMVEAINACNLTPEMNAAIRQILSRERNEKNVFVANNHETIEQFDKIIDEAVREKGL